MINEIIDDEGNAQTSSTAILKVFSTHFCKKFEPIHMEVKCINQLVSRGMRGISPEMNDDLTAPISAQELWLAICKGKANKALRPDGICLEFYKSAWNAVKHDILNIINSMYQDGLIERKQLQGPTVCLPKKSPLRRIEDYRPLTLLNSDYKTITRIIANRFRSYRPTIIHPSHYCGIKGRSIFEAVATVRDVIAYAEVMKKPICVMSLDFSAAFDKASHSYMKEALSAYGFSMWFTESIMRLYSNASSEVQIKGFRSNMIRIKSSIRQGCPLSMPYV